MPAVLEKVLAEKSGAITSPLVGSNKEWTAPKQQSKAKPTRVRDGQSFFHLNTVPKLHTSIPMY